MPREDRRIYFDYTETYKAIYAMCTQKEMKRPQPGNVVSIEQSTKDPAMLDVKYQNGLDDSSSVVEYSRDFVAAALMLYCRSLGIPLPKNAQKATELVPNTVILRIQI